MMLDRTLGAVLLAAVLACGDGGAPVPGTKQEEPSAPSAASAPAPVNGGDVDADLAELGRYRLTMDRMEKFFQASRNLKLAAEANPELERPESDGSESLEEMTALVEANPVYRKAIRDAGLSPREYVAISMAYLQAGFALAMSAQPGVDADSLAASAGVSPHNLAFVREHQSELTRMARRVEDASQAEGTDSDG